jgi:hypothetical protein
MDAIASAETFILENPSATDSHILRQLLDALRSGSLFDVHSLYDLNLTSFDVAVDVLNAWRLQRYARGGVVLPVARLDRH